MNDLQRDQIAAAFERELSRAPMPFDLRTKVVRTALRGRREHPTRAFRWVPAVVAAILALAITVTIAVGAHTMRPVPVKGGAPSPGPRGQASWAYDAAQGRMVVFGGTADNRTDLGDTWTFDGTTWTSDHSSSQPIARVSAPMAYDVAHKVVVLFGGTNTPVTKAAKSNAPTTYVALNDTWIWNGSSWRKANPVESPPPAPQATNPLDAMGYDPVSGRVLLYRPAFVNTPTQLWAWNGTDWALLHPATDPQLSGVSLVSDGRRLLMIGPAFEGGRFISQTWTWGGGDWAQLHPAINPPSGAISNAVFDAANGQVVTFNGADTWVFDGSNWTRRHPAVSPASAGYMSYIAGLRKVISWSDQNNVRNTDLWAWDGTNWTQLRGVSQSPTDNRTGGVNGTLSPPAAATYIRQTVTATRPVLLPTSLPSGMEATSMEAASDSFSVQYQSDQRDKNIMLGIVVANPPPSPGKFSDARVKFRGVTAEYFVYDSTSPLSQRWLMWNEPGTSPTQLTKAPGVPYFLSTDGLTDAEFWQLANSLK